ncbi:MAG TPA: sulfurtransferase TusA family protein [Acidiferrobacterales bacterium]
MSRHQLDARRLLCPMPVIRTQNRIQALLPGDELEVHCTDPGALHDIPAWCRLHGHEVVSASSTGDAVTVVVRVATNRDRA